MERTFFSIYDFHAARHNICAQMTSLRMRPITKGTPMNRASQDGEERLRVGFVAGTLGVGGAEKQLTYMAAALQRAGVEVEVYCLQRGEAHEHTFKQMQIPVLHFGQVHSVPMRTWRLWRHVRHFRPHILQSAHFFTNVYAGLVARALPGEISIGAVRSGLQYLFDLLGAPTRLGLSLPHSIIVNSHSALEEAHTMGLPAERFFVLPNVIDRSAYNPHELADDRTAPDLIKAIFVGRLVPEKRVEHFLQALAAARREVPHLVGYVVGDGPERARWERTAADLGLLGHGVAFLGQRKDVPQLLLASDMLVLFSDYEGSPNVIIEAMAAGLPVISTPAGDAKYLVLPEKTGYLVPFGDISGMAEHLVILAQSPALRAEMGAAAQRLVEANHDPDHLANRLMTIYRDIARRRHANRLLKALERYV